MKYNLPLSQICKIVLSGTPKTSVPEYWNGDIKWVTPADITKLNDRYIFDTEKKITKDGIENSSAKLLKKNSIIISARGTVGELCIISSEMSCNQSCYALEGIPELVRNLYLFYILKNLKTLYAQIAHGTTFDTITKITFDQIKINLPSLDEQDKLIPKLDNIDCKIELLQNQNKILEQMAQAIFKSWFIDFDGVTEFEDSELGKIPKGWSVKSFSDIVNIGSGKRPNEKNETKTTEYKIPCYGSSKIDSYVKEPLFENPILLTGRVGTLGIIHRVYSPCFPSDNTLTILPDENIFFEFVYFNLLQIDYSSHNRGTSQPLITQTDLKNIQIIVPYSELIVSFNNQIKHLFKKIEENKFQIDTLTKTRDALLPKLMSGEIRV